jgi:ketosteroid isomerase-like protein
MPFFNFAGCCGKTLLISTGDGHMDTLSNEAQNLSTARQYLGALERMEEAGVIARFFHTDLVQEEFPNRLVPNGARRDLNAVLEGVESGRRIMKSQRYEVLNALAAGEQVILEVDWSGELSTSLGEQFPAGFQFHARFAVFLEFQDGKIIAQRNYDCYDPW